MSFIESERLVGLIVMSSFCVVGTSGNLFTIIALLKSQTLHIQASTKFVVSLAIADLLFCSICLPLIILDGLGFITEKYTEAYCHWLVIILCTIFAASSFSLLAITINRCIIICYYDIYDKIYSGLNVYIMISVIWLCSIAISMVPGYGVWGQIKRIQEYQCEIVPDENGNNPVLFLITIHSFIPCIVLIACYVLIFLKKKQVKKELNESLGHKKSYYKEEDLQLLKMIGIIFAGFLICYMPRAFIYIVYVNDEFKSESIQKFYFFSNILFGINFIINPFIYGFKNKVYRPAFVSLYQKLYNFFLRICPFRFS